MYTPKLFKKIKNGLKGLSIIGKIIVIGLGLVSIAGFVGLFIQEPMFFIPVAVFAIAYETAD